MNTKSNVNTETENFESGAARNSSSTALLALHMSVSDLVNIAVDDRLEIKERGDRIKEIDAEIRELEEEKRNLINDRFMLMPVWESELRDMIKNKLESISANSKVCDEA